MYIPKTFKQEDPDKALLFIKRFHFGTLISVNNQFKPLATHIPFATEVLTDQSIRLYSHIAKENEQWKSFVEKQALAIFQAPHAYISPELYTREQSVPTWNYEAVHVYGVIRLLKSEAELDQMMEKMIDFLEPEYFKKWGELDHSYKLKLYHALVGIEFEVQEIQAVEKLSQDRQEDEKLNIISHLSNSTADHERYIADSMKKKFGNNTP